MINLKKGLFLGLLALSACASNQNSSGDCKTKAACLNDPNCLCWCSVKCGYRKKMDNDHPIYIKNDRNKKFCYCKQWDLDEYKSNCIEHKDISQPEGAQ